VATIASFGGFMMNVDFIKEAIRLV
jgi:hypothetical protein